MRVGIGFGSTAIAGAFVAVTTLVVAIVVAPVGAPQASAAPPTSGSVIVDEGFTGATLTDSAWTGLGATCLTGAPSGSTPSPTLNNCSSSQSGPVPAIGVTDGYLQLTDTHTSTNGTLLYNRSIPASAGISVEFEQYQYGGGGADGIGFFLVDGATNLTQGGGTGGSLGYSQRYSTAGILGGYIGVGFDAFGNFYADGESKGSNCPSDQRSPSTSTGSVAANVVTLRGPGNGTNGYCYQGSTTDPASNPNKPTSTLPGTLRAPTGTTLPTAAKRLVNVQVTTGSNPRVIVQIDFGTGSGWQTVLDKPAPANAPSSYKFGFGGATGGVTDVHLLRNVKVSTIQPLGNLQITKQIDRSGAPLPAVITAGTQIPYQYIVTNAGFETVDSLTVTDNKIASVTCDSTSLPPAPDPAASTVCRGSYTVSALDVVAGVVTNTASASGIGSVFPNATVTSNLDTVTLQLVSQLTLTKAVTTAAPYVVGQNVSYSYSVANTGRSTVSNITVSDNRAAGGKVICDATSLAPSTVAHCTLTTTVLSGYLSASGSLLNTASASGVTTLGQSVASNQAKATIQVGTDVQVTKTTSNASPLVGQQVTFVVSTANVGPAAASTVVINDLLPTGLTLVRATPSAGAYNSTTGNWTIPTLAVASPPATLTVIATVTAARVITNAASLLTLDQPDTNPANNTASVSLNPVVPTTDIAINMFVDSASIRVGQTANFTVSATNNGPQPATGVTVRDALPSRLQFVSTSGAYDPASGIWTVGSLAVGQTVSVNIEVLATAVGSFQNTAGVASVSPQDVNQSNNIDHAALTVTAAIADLQIVKSIVGGTEGVNVGDFITYFVTVTNAGPDSVPDVVVAETHVPGLTIQTQDFTATNPSQGTVDPTDLIWSIGTLASGGTATIAIRVEVLTTGTKINVATVSSATVDDPDQSNNTDIASLSIGPAELDLAVTKTRLGPAQVTMGQPVTFSIEVTNNGPAEATDVELFDPLPAGLTYSSSAPSAGSFDSATSIWSLASLSSGASETITLTGMTVRPGTATNTVSVQSLNESDANPANNSASAFVDVVVKADLAISKSVSPAVAQPGDTVTYTITVTNDGPNNADNVQVVDPAQIEANLTGSTVTQGAFDIPSRVWEVGTLNSGDTATLTLTVLLTKTGTFLNTVVISQSSIPDPNRANDQAQATLDIPSADLSVAATVDDSSSRVGQQVTFTISARNLGPEATTSAVITSLLPAGLSYVSSLASVGGYNDATGLWTIGSLGVNAPAETLVITATATAVGAVVDVATISASAPYDPDQSNNTASISFTIAAGGGGSGGQLAATGTSTGTPLTAAVLLLALGIVALQMRRQRRRLV